MNPVAQWLIFGGALLLVAGIVWQPVGRHLPLRRLPGDVIVERGNVRFYFPIVTCLVISAILTLLSWLWRSR